MQQLPESQEINEYVKEYFRHMGFMNALECFEAEIKTKQVSTKVKPKNIFLKLKLLNKQAAAK